MQRIDVDGDSFNKIFEREKLILNYNLKSFCHVVINDDIFMNENSLI